MVRIFICILVFQCYVSVCFAETTVRKETIPAWVKPQTFTTDLPANIEIQNEHYLLSDRQIHVEEKTVFQHIVVKILDEFGVESRSNILVSFDPAYQQLKLHQIDVIRDGQRINKMDNAHFEILQMEKDPQKLMYNGTLTFVAFLEDIRVNDIIDYSFSVEGINPFATPHYHDFICFELSNSVNKVFQRVVANSSRKFSFKSKESATIENKPVGDNLCEWCWEKYHTDIATYEKGQPAWFHDDKRIEFGDYPNWKSVVDILVNHFSLSQDVLDQECCPEMQELIQEWQRKPSEEEKAIAAIRFVQDKVRYLFLDTATSALVPNNPHTVFKRRFGDCKDKTQLLHFLLKKMNIESYHCLVHTELGKNLPEKLPHCAAFNHVVLQVIHNDKTAWIDPTIMLQGGKLDSIHFPNYHYGLLLKPGMNQLVTFSKKPDQPSIQMTSIFDFLTQDQVKLTVNSLYSAEDADYMRKKLKLFGEKKLLETYETYYKGFYNELKKSLPLEVIDDREANIIALKETYDIPNIWDHFDDEKNFKIHPSYVNEYLVADTDSDRKTPLAITFPINVREEIIVKNSEGHWSRENPEMKIEENFLKWVKKTDVKPTEVHFSFEYQTLADHVLPHQVSDYVDTLQEIRSESKIIVNKQKAIVSSSVEKMSNLYILILPILLNVIVLLAFWFRKRKKLKIVNL